MQKNFIVIALALNILFFVFAKEIAIILFWQKYETSWLILQYSILFLVFNFLLQINFNILAWIWKVKERLKIILIALVFNFILNIILINWIDFINFEWIWVYWAALATWFGWILISILSEIKLWKKYFSNFDYKFLIKNIIFLWILWVFSYTFINPLFEWSWRLNSLLIMFLIWIIWFSLFGLVNIKEFKGFILEVKKMKWKK
jgi:O-antigen/teichoic acid export membrane protein